MSDEERDRRHDGELVDVDREPREIARGSDLDLDTGLEGTDLTWKIRRERHANEVGARPHLA